MGDPLEILELRSAIAGATAAEVRRIIDVRLPQVSPPVTEPEFNAWTWSLYDLGLAAETIPDARLALDLYARSIDCNRSTEHLRSAAMVRSGLCLEQLGRWMEAKQLYQDATQGSFGWTETRAILLWRLGCLQAAAEEFGPALSSFGQLLELLPQPGIAHREVVLEWCACAERTGRLDEAEKALAQLAAGSGPESVEALRRLSSLYLRSGRASEAVSTLSRIAAHPMAEPGIRTAAALRLDHLQSRKE